MASLFHRWPLESELEFLSNLGGEDVTKHRIMLRKYRIAMQSRTNWGELTPIDVSKIKLYIASELGEVKYFSGEYFSHNDGAKGLPPNV